MMRTRRRTAPALAEITDVAGLEAGIISAAPIGDPYPLAPARAQRRETRLLVLCNVGIAGVAQHIEMETFAATGSIQARQHRLEIADHPLRQFVADAQQDRGRRRHRLVAADTRRHRHHSRHRIDRKMHDQKPDHGVPESRHHPGQRDREQNQQYGVDDREAARRQRQRGKRQGASHGGGKQDSKQHAPAENIVSGGGLQGLGWGALQHAVTTSNPWGDSANSMI
jgi:hypothetical protein